MEKVNTRIKDLRINKGLTQSQLGDMVGYSKQMICMIENGRREIDFLQLTRMASLFGVSVDYLINGKAAEKSFIDDIIDMLEDMDEAKIEKVYQIVKVMHE